MSPNPAVQLLLWRDCPSWEEALALLRDEMEAAGLDPRSLDVREIRTDADADRAQMRGCGRVLLMMKPVIAPRARRSGHLPVLGRDYNPIGGSLKCSS